MKDPLIVDEFIGIFKSHLDFVKQTKFEQFDQLYKKMICITIIDTIAKTKYPKDDNRDRFCKLLSDISKYDFWNKVSPLMLYKRKGKTNKEILNLFNNWNSFANSTGVSKDPDINSICTIGNKIIEKSTHKRLIYHYRCCMIHEFKRPDGGSQYDTKIDRLPLYVKQPVIEFKDNLKKVFNTNSKSIKLIYPLGFFIDLCDEILIHARNYYLENDMNPFNFFDYDELEIQVDRR